MNKTVTIPSAILGRSIEEIADRGRVMVSVTPDDLANLKHLLEDKAPDDVVKWKGNDVLVAFGRYLAEYLDHQFKEAGHEKD